VKEDIVDHFRDEVLYPLYELDMDIMGELGDVPQRGPSLRYAAR
jgi:hypothetical protein